MSSLHHGNVSRLWQWRPELLSEEEVLSAWSEALAHRGERGQPDALSLYVNIPYCASRCRYCMYWSRLLTDKEQAERYVDYLVGLMGRWRARLGRLAAQDAYIGGGTPALLSAPLLDRLLRKLSELCAVKGAYTVEANPGALDAKKIKILRRAGVNRLSMGIQSLDPRVLEAIGRNNPPVEVLAGLVETARGMLVNLDLVIGLPQQTRSSVRRDIRAAMSVGADSITVYRYQPVPHLPAESMRYGEVIDAGLIIEALRGGYVYLNIGPDAYSVTFIRNSAVGRRQISRIAWGALGWLAGGRDHFGYDSFDRIDAHLMGLGPGAFSHLCGVGWVREVTSLQRLTPDTRAVYCGTRVSSFQECCIAVAKTLAAGGWVNLRRLARDHGEENSRRLVALASQSGVVRCGWRWLRFRLGVHRPERDAFLQRLFPPVPPDQNVLWRFADGSAITSERLEPGLMPQSLGPSPVLRQWAELLDLSGVGDHLNGAEIVAVGRDFIRLRVAPHPAPELEVQVHRPGDTPSYGHSQRFAISWRPLGRDSLSDAESRFLDHLVSRMQELDPAPFGI